MALNRVLLTTLFVSLFITSCKKAKIEKGVSGWWTIDTISYKRNDIGDCFLSSSIFFKKNKVEFPTINRECLDTIRPFGEEGKWKIESSNDYSYINIEIPNIVFRGRHKIIFHRDEANKLLKMEIISDSFYAVCRKGLFCYDCEQSFIDDIVEK